MSVVSKIKIAGTIRLWRDLSFWVNYSCSLRSVSRWDGIKYWREYGCLGVSKCEDDIHIYYDIGF